MGELFNSLPPQKKRNDSYPRAKKEKEEKNILTAINIYVSAGLRGEIYCRVHLHLSPWQFTAAHNVLMKEPTNALRQKNNERL